ncbi:MAG: hypothetical protein ABI972_32425, partial [Acidobacteriota bacterium]
MSLSDWIAARFRYRRFARGGQNIARRYAALQPYWEPHLEASRAVQRGWDAGGRRLRDRSLTLDEPPLSALAAGAGRLTCELDSADGSLAAWRDVVEMDEYVV